jgi:hypothetical protein
LKIVRDFYSHQPLGPNPQSRPMALVLSLLSYCLVWPNCFPPWLVCHCPAQPIWPACSLLFLYFVAHSGPTPAHLHSFVLTTPAEAEPSTRATACRAPLPTGCHIDLDSARVRSRLARTPSPCVRTAIILILLIRAWSRIKMERNQESNLYQIRNKLLRNLSIRLEISIGTFLRLHLDS